MALGQILNSRRPARRLHIGQSQTLSVIPSLMLTWEPEEGKPYRLLEKQYAVLAEIESTRSGGDGFELLLKGKVGLALVPGDLLNQLGPDCRRVCSLSCLFTAGIATQRIESVYDLKGQTFGFLSGSAFGTRLSLMSHGWGIEVPPAIAMQTRQDCVQALLAGQVHGMIGSEPSVSRIRRAVERSLHVFPVRQGVLGYFEMHVAVNLKVAHAATVRAYLCGLQETTRYANGRKSVAAFQTEVASRFNMDPWDFRDVFINTIFSLGDPDPATALTMWEREVVRPAQGLNWRLAHGFLEG